MPIRARSMIFGSLKRRNERFAVTRSALVSNASWDVSMSGPISPGLLCFADGVFDRLHPFGDELGDAVANGSGPNVHLCRGGDEEAAPGEDAAFEV